MRYFELRTLGAISLDGPSGPVRLDEPHLVALLVMLATAGDAGVGDDDLMLRLFPNATPQHARTELARLVAVLRLRLGDEDSVRRNGSALALARGLVRADVRVLAESSPVERPDFLAGFRLPSSPEFDEWLTEMRQRVEPVGGERRSASRVWRRAGIIVAALAIVTLTVTELIGRSRDTASAGGESLLLADVANETADSLFDGLLRAATIGLEQSRHVRLYPRSRLPEVYQRMQIADRDTALDFMLAQEVAEREGVRFVLGLRVAREDGGYRISSDLVDIVHGATRSSDARADRRDEVIAALGSVLHDVRRQLGESRAELAQRAAPLPQVTTSSLEALRSYAAGADAWRRGKYALARDLWERAVDLDTSFASALGMLGRYHAYHHERERSHDYYQAALSKADRLTERERLRIEASRAADRGDHDSAIVVFRSLAERFPSAVTWENYGTMLLRAQRDTEAVPAFRKALSLDSTSVISVGAWINLATVLSRLDRDEEAIDASHRAARLDSTVLYRGNLNHEYGQRLVRVRRYAEAESAYRRMAGGTSLVDRAAGLRSLGFLEMWRGRIEEGAAHFEQAANITREDHKPLSEARNRLLLAWSYRLLGRQAMADAELDRVLTMTDSPVMEPMFLSFIVSALVRHERLDDAESVLGLLRARVDSVNAGDVAAEMFSAAAIALARRRPGQALDLARQAGVYRQPQRLQMLTAEIHAAAGRQDSARALLATLLQNEAFGFEAQEDWLRAPILLGDLRLANGDTAGARQAYQLLLERWRDAPRSLPDMIAVRGRLISIGPLGDSSVR